MKKRKTIINISIIIFMAIVWALEEVYLGGWLKNTNIAVAGLWLSLLAVIIILIGKSLVPLPASIILLGIIAALAKSLLLGYYMEGPIIALLLESLAGELMILLFKMRRIAFLLTGVLVFCITAFHALILSGELIDTAYFETFKEWFFSLFQIKSFPVNLFIIIYTCIHLLIGTIAGLLTWYFSKTFVLKKVK